jgi:hypothetical protein
MNFDQVTTITGALAGIFTGTGVILSQTPFTKMAATLGSVGGVFMALTGYFTNKR